MKRLLIALLIIGAFCSYLYAQEGVPAGHDYKPAVETNNWVWLRYEGDNTDSMWAISSIDWVSASGVTAGANDTIAAASGFLLTTSDGSRIAECVATSVSDQCHFTFPEPVIANGLSAEWLDGSLYIYGKRR